MCADASSFISAGCEFFFSSSWIKEKNSMIGLVHLFCKVSLGTSSALLSFTHKIHKIKTKAVDTLSLILQNINLPMLPRNDAMDLNFKLSGRIIFDLIRRWSFEEFEVQTFKESKRDCNYHEWKTKNMVHTRQGVQEWGKISTTSFSENWVTSSQKMLSMKNSNIAIPCKTPWKLAFWPKKMSPIYSFNTLQCAVKIKKSANDNICLL